MCASLVRMCSPACYPPLIAHYDHICQLESFLLLNLGPVIWNCLDWQASITFLTSFIPLYVLFLLLPKPKRSSPFLFLLNFANIIETKQFHFFLIFSAYKWLWRVNLKNVFKQCLGIGWCFLNFIGNHTTKHLWFAYVSSKHSEKSFKY